MKINLWIRRVVVFTLGAQALVCATETRGSRGLWDAFTTARHRAEAVDKGYRLENPENRIAAGFDRRGMIASHPLGGFSMKLAAYGFRGHLHMPEKAMPSANGSVVEYRRGLLTEWYRNDVRGIEQGFTLRERPAGPRGSMLTFELLTSGELQPAAHGADVRFERDGRQVLNYSGIRAWDAAGKSLPARMEVKGRRIYLLLSDRDASYPVTLDPWLEQQDLTAPDGAAGDYFGASVSVSGDSAVIGAPRKQIGGNSQQGAAYVFVRSGGSWTLQQRLTASDGAASDLFGFSVSINGDTAVIGASGKTNSMNGGYGAAYVFTRTNGVWTTQQELASSDGQHQNFGTSVSVSGDTAVIGAYEAPQLSSAPNQGAAYIFVRTGGVWAQQQMLTSEGTEDDRFGTSVSVNGATVLVGAFQKRLGSNANQGAAYVYVSGGGPWTLQQRLTAADGATVDEFGASVSLSGDTALVGAWGKSVAGQNSQGAAYVFTRSAGSWSQQQELISSDGAAQDNFGRSVALSVNTAVIAAPSKQVGANTAQGKSYVFGRRGTVWTLQQSLVPAEGAANDLAGISSVALDGRTALVGAPNKQVAANANQGSAFVFITNSPAVGSDFDLNGIPDLVWQSEASRQVVVDYYGGVPATTILSWNWLYPGLGASGWHVAAIADFNGDGMPDLVWQNDTTRQVTVHYYGGTGGATDLGWNWLYAGTGGIGWHVVAAADFNGDGVPDLVWQNDTTRQVVIHYYGGSGGATDLGWTWLYIGGGGVGWHVAGAADFNGDGVPDLVWQNDTTGQVVVHYYGGAGGATDMGWTWLYTNVVQGWHVAKVIDFNGDGVPDLVWENDSTGQVTVHYYGGSGGAADLGWDWLFTGNAAGWSVR